LDCKNKSKTFFKRKEKRKHPREISISSTHLDGLFFRDWLGFVIYVNNIDILIFVVDDFLQKQLDACILAEFHPHN
jgi:hypothetical protein